MHHFDSTENVVLRVVFSFLIYVLILVSKDQAIQNFSFYCSTIAVGLLAIICLLAGVASNGRFSVDLILFYSAYELFMVVISLFGVVSFHLHLPYPIDNEVFAVVLFIRAMLFIYFVAYALHKEEKRERGKCDIVAV
ncbi:hypothetical protein L596_009762 [Steinernema carpocapsae]|uniref:Uncharacterized protein n=1 Tax=Steinernema carpocapsae TaxID=34508 RepID=A0A4U5PH44_STECR|nr:hypothetical protein L596_009762 [Steinernema carpocapsae]